ncbi:MAG: CDP-alcohol phosphatidyltransferase [Arcobacter sp.]|nr:MAG: CDP-alcohol phosphatidyltransferase [Arcobacter sp.]
MYKTCPISKTLIDENIVRIQAGLITALAISFIIYPSSVFLIILSLDFLVRVLAYKAYSPLFLISRFCTKVFNLSAHKVDAGPKKFAAKIGLIFSVLSLVLYLFGAHFFTQYLVVALGLCAFAESAFGFCVGCKLYSGLQYFSFNKVL